MSSSVLFENASIITFDDKVNGFEVVSPGSLLVTDDVIAGIYKITPDYTSLPYNTERVPCYGKIISPGFIDTHRHGWQSALRTLGANTTLPVYMQQHGQYAAQGNYTAEDVYIGQLEGLYECLNSGVTTTVDHAHHTWDAATSRAGVDACLDSGSRVFWCYTFQTLQNGYDHIQQLACAEAIMKDERLRNSAVEIGVAYDGWNSDPEENVKTIVDFATRNKAAVVTTHTLGGPWIFDNGPSVLDKHGLLQTDLPVVFSHACTMSTEDVALLRKSNQYISITPESEMHYGMDNSRSHTIMDQASLGVDTYFTFSGDIISQARIWLQATRRELFRKELEAGSISTKNQFDVEQVFYLATVSGGLALRRPDLGKIKVGAKADLVVFDGDSPNMLGFVDPIAAVILHSNPGDVRHVLVDGKWRKKNGELLPSVTGKVWGAIRGRFVRSAREVQKWATKPPPVVEGSWVGCTPYVVPEKVNVKRL